ncbi:MAG: ammonia-forming cytochrome c nitrite reductase subunit c552 [Pirellulales bacterium]|nr:ammonia-forming cytochrome c nitrite reductase subunit c552 [Pirellulales bacterium]
MNQPNAPQPRKLGRRTLALLAVFMGTAVAAALVTALLVNIFERKEEARNPYLKLVNVTENTTDPAPWGMNWPREYDQYKRTSEASHTNFGGGDAPVAREKAERDPWLTRMFAGYAFSLDYRDRRGHAYMLIDQERTRRVTERPQPGSCLHCHSSIMPTYRKAGDGDVMKGFEKVCAMTYQDALKLVIETGSENPVPSLTGQEFRHVEGAHPVSCVDCHDPQTMELRVTRPAFLNGIKALKKHQGIEDYDPNRDATRQEMRSFVCAQCHVEYYCGPKTTLFFPWNKGLKVEEIESYYDRYHFSDGHRFYDWKHAESGAEVLKAQHPEFELWNQGIHARSGVACADCHMPYMREGAMKVSDHYVRSPLLMINRSCQVCHPQPEDELKSRVLAIQERNYALMKRAGVALIDMLDAIDAAKKAGVNEAQLAGVWELQRRAQWRLDFVVAENSMGFHAPQEAARILGEAIDYARQAQVAAQTLITAGRSSHPPK